MNTLTIYQVKNGVIELKTDSNTNTVSQAWLNEVKNRMQSVKNGKTSLLDFTFSKNALNNYGTN